MHKINILISTVALLLGSSVSTWASDVAAQFKVQEGGRSGEGVLHQVPFVWESTADIVKTSPVATLRTTNFAGESITFDFESPVTVNSVILYSVNPTSQSYWTFYDSNDQIIPVDRVEISSPNEVGDFPSSLGDDGGLFFSAAWSDKSNYEAKISFLEPVYGVKKLKVEFREEPGILDLRIRGVR